MAFVYHLMFLVFMVFVYLGIGFLWIFEGSTFYLEEENTSKTIQSLFYESLKGTGYFFETLSEDSVHGSDHS